MQQAERAVPSRHDCTLPITVKTRRNVPTRQMHRRSRLMSARTTLSRWCCSRYGCLRSCKCVTKLQAFSSPPNKPNPVPHTVITNDHRSLTIVASGILSHGSADDQHPTLDQEKIDQKEIDLCHQWLSRATIANPPQLSSFWIKHVVENWAGQNISNGALIVAAFEAGFEIAKPIDEAGPNVAIGLDSTDIREFDCGCGHP